MLKFDKETTRLLDIVYQGADITRRRQASFDALRPEADEKIVDIGCGNGLLTLELARAVGSGGKAIGVDPSPDMLGPAQARCKAFDCVEILTGTANDLPIETGTLDKAVSVQVFEYLDDIPAAIVEAGRVLKPGGRLVIGDIHLDSLVWFSDDKDRMDRMIASWDHHFTRRDVPAILPSIMRDAGFVVENVVPLTTCDHTLKPDGLAMMMMRLMARYAVDNNHVPAQEAAAWLAEQKALAAQGRFFYALTHFVVSARKSAP
ncbi:methyltransferase domain-containing protein [Pseudosulfitobacter sp. DSM 107133]|uniref:methyltransferase domain-containing protein n=1 Tax=Pseudosulfitobacter sp. DSM 107133 TaxID=2883100 RepID=UPI000DF3CD15|nr:methyltransferase domain-containing protein [Pseudosulfitobacter sp. DSM 107133]UOA26622.1 putative methyltransferase [Pseudosulfitobacter sp. DSM 107133]